MLLLVGCAGGTRPQPQPQPTGGGLTRLDLAVRAVSADRASVLAGVDAVQKAASALDLTDEVCASGKGVAARTAYRAAEPLTRRAQSCWPKAAEHRGALTTTSNARSRARET